MHNFEFYNPVKVIFGQDTISHIALELPPEAKPLLLYGGGSIKNNGVYNQIADALRGRDLVEFGGILSNPTYEKCLEALEVIKKKKLNFIIAAGGGSVIDAAKFLAVATKYKGDPWEILEGKAPQEALPIGVILTLPATGTEMNMNSVISKAATQEKLSFASPLVYPQFSILDPSVTYSLPPRQTANGIIDAFIHVCEQYVTIENATPLQDRQAEAILSTLVEEGPLVMKDPQNYAARSNIMWSATNALNHIISCGTVGDWATHMIGHELTALYGLDHAVTLAIITPRLWTARMDKKRDKLHKYAERIWGLTGSNAITKAIGKTEQFFNNLGVKTSLEEYGIDSAKAAVQIKDRFTERGTQLGEYGDITPGDVAAIVRAC